MIFKKILSTESFLWELDVKKMLLLKHSINFNKNNKSLILSSNDFVIKMILSSKIF